MNIHTVDPFVTMKELHGSCGFLRGAPVMGRLGDAGRGARIAVVREPPLPDEEDLVGIVWVGTLPPPREIKLPLLCLEELPIECLGRISLLDPRRGTLFVSPDLQTLNRYFPKLGQRERESAPEGSIPNVGVGRFRLSAVLPSVDASLPDGLRDGAVFLPCGIGEEELFEQIRCIAERDPSCSLSLVLSAEAVKGGAEQLRPAIRGIFRGSVYGRFSLLLRGVIGSSSLEETLSAVHRCFCELEEEGREFNGYLPKGILVDTPLLLCDGAPQSGVDRICYDLTALAESMRGAYPSVPEHAVQLCRCLRRHAAQAPLCKKSLLLQRGAPESCFLDLLKREDFDEVFLPEEELPSLREALLSLEGVLREREP